MSESRSGSSSFGFGTVLFLIFMTLKLCGVIDWSWWWVTAPIWIPFSLVVVMLSLLGVVRFVESKRIQK